MPDKLFYPVGVNTVIMLFKAGVPQGSQKSFTGDISDDGFETVKNQGRQDVRGCWNGIKNAMLKAFYNHEEKTNYSALFVPTNKNEWIVEAYMRTDYSHLTEKDLIKVVRQ